MQVNLTETVEKTSPTLGREAQYTKTSLISRLPPYLTVQVAPTASRLRTSNALSIRKAAAHARAPPTHALMK